MLIRTRCLFFVHAIWHWHMAQTLYPKSADSDLSMFGEPGADLKKHLLDWTFVPATRDGVAVSSQACVSVAYKLP